MADRHLGAGVASVVAPGPGVRSPCGRSTPESGVLVLDIACILGVIALFALVGLIGKAVEKL